MLSAPSSTTSYSHSTLSEPHVAFPAQYVKSVKSGSFPNLPILQLFFLLCGCLENGDSLERHRFPKCRYRTAVTPASLQPRYRTAVTPASLQPRYRTAVTPASLQPRYRTAVTPASLQPRSSPTASLPQDLLVAGGDHEEVGAIDDDRHPGGISGDDLLRPARPCLPPPLKPRSSPLQRSSPHDEDVAHRTLLPRAGPYRLHRKLLSIRTVFIVNSSLCPYCLHRKLLSPN